MLWISKTRVDLDDAVWPRKLDDAVWPRTHPNSILRRQSKMFLNALMVLYISVTGGKDVRGRGLVVGLVRIGALQSYALIQIRARPSRCAAAAAPRPETPLAASGSHERAVHCARWEGTHEKFDLAVLQETFEQCTCITHHTSARVCR